MRYQSSSAISYFFRNFWKYIYIVLPVAIFMGVFANFSSETQFFYQWRDGVLEQDTYVGTMMRSMLLVGHVNEWWQGIVTYLLLAVTFSLLIVKVSRHMRVGGFSLLPLKSAMKVMPAMLLYCACFALLTMALEFVGFGIMYILSRFLPMSTVIAIGLVLLWAAKVGAVYAWMLLLLCFPLSYSENYPFNVAMSYSAREMSSRKGACIGYALLYATLYSLVLVLDYFITIPVVVETIYGLFFTFVIYYVPCLAFTIHHQSLGSERKDIERVLIG